MRTGCSAGLGLGDGLADGIDILGEHPGDLSNDPGSMKDSRLARLRQALLTNPDARLETPLESEVPK